MTPRSHRARPGLALAAVALAGCGGGLRSASPARGVEAAGLPFVVLDGRSGRELPAAELWTWLRDARAVCAGEQHPSPHDHWAQLQILDHVSAPAAGTLALGLEMVQRPFQGVLDDWSAGRIDDATLLARTGWQDRWGFDFALYRPMLALARQRQAVLLALNAPSELVKRIAKGGVDGLAADDRARLPALVLDDARHRAWFDRVMASMGEDHGDPHAQPPPPAADATHAPAADAAPAPPADAAHQPTPPADAAHAHVHHRAAMPSADAIYAAQVLWDESMADGAARWLAAGGGRVVILAGNGHCHDSAIVGRLTRRGVAPVVSVRPIVDDGAGNVADAIAEGIHDYLFVMTPPRR
jgi:uncharacterized iron-regulated protein